jgi:hypothetical protein
MLETKDCAESNQVRCTGRNEDDDKNKHWKIHWKKPEDDESDSFWLLYNSNKKAFENGNG